MNEGTMQPYEAVMQDGDIPMLGDVWAGWGSEPVMDYGWLHPNFGTLYTPEFPMMLN